MFRDRAIPEYSGFSCRKELGQQKNHLKEPVQECADLAVALAAGLPVSMAHLKFYFALPVSPCPSPALFLIESFGSCAGFGAQPDRFCCLLKVPIEHDAVELLAYTFAFELGP